MKRTPLKRKAPLRRPPYRRSRKRPEGWDLPAYLAAVRALPCCCPRPYHDGPGHKEWRGPVVAHHPRLLELGAGAGQKCPDDCAIPLADLCHRDLHSLRGVFAGWSGEYLREWQLREVARTRALVGCAGVEEIGTW